ncbi:hypothetical protein ACFWR4_27490 [Streptomyces hydrogenans]|uniref:hypothetical protein n=1 Tax=Streptomyces TaxID=1883 RepID=UPI0024B7AEE0|nr:hypothetical protein [Streptomyces sp. HNM0645]MDI9885570.1 hypothetical protein [Streptomyces sp. HNM0645]
MKRLSAAAKLTALLFTLALPTAALAAPSGLPAAASATASPGTSDTVSPASSDDDLGWG